MPIHRAIQEANRSVRLENVYLSVPLDAQSRRTVAEELLQRYRRSQEGHNDLLQEKLDVWTKKRPLAHALRMEYSGDRVTQYFGWRMLVESARYDLSSDYLKLLYSAGVSPAIAWTIAPHLLGITRNLYLVSQWIAKADRREEERITLPGLEDLRTRPLMVLPNRWDPVSGSENTKIPPVFQHPNYAIAASLARYLVSEGFVR